jgi:hypothetical protein
METLILHFAVDQNVNLDTSIGNWAVIGVIIRIAFRMGLHRDPSHWPGIQPLQAELRRRLWIVLYQMDFFTSVQVGLPRIIKDSQCDTHPPKHLLDHDIGSTHNELPPERPNTQPASLLFVIQRNTIIKVAAEIYDVTEAGPLPPATITSLGAKLESAMDAIPPWLKYKSFETAVADDPVIILHQIVLDILKHKAEYLLHRRSFMKVSNGEENASLNEHCIQAALSILAHQPRMSEETEPGGIMYDIRWKVDSSLNHEFLQATTMLCFALSKYNERDAISTSSPVSSQRGDILQALTTAKSLWEKNASRSAEARRAVDAITIVLQQSWDRASAPTSAATEGEHNMHPGSFGSLMLVNL